MTDKTKTEISFEVERDDCSVLDGYCNARNITRTAQMRKILKEWSELELHSSTVVCRTAGVNPMQSGRDRG